MICVTSLCKAGVKFSVVMIEVLYFKLLVHFGIMQEYFYFGIFKPK